MSMRGPERGAATGARPAAFALAAALLLVGRGTLAQFALDPGAADLEDPRVALGNPAAVPFSVTTLFFGYHTFQMGFLEDPPRTYAASFSAPYWFRGGGVNTQWFKSKGFSVGRVDFLYGRKLSNAFSAGLKGGLVTKQFHSEAFGNYDPSDPLLTSTSSFGLALGAETPAQAALQSKL